MHRDAISAFEQLFFGLPSGEIPLWSRWVSARGHIRSRPGSLIICLPTPLPVPAGG